jgi:uncharacterized protein YqcC (DUF446 family)
MSKLAYQDSKQENTSVYCCQTLNQETRLKIVIIARMAAVIDTNCSIIGNKELTTTFPM